MFGFRKVYFLWAITIFLIEVVIALFVHDRFVRPYLGDVLVVILLYSLVKSFFDWRPRPVALGVLIFAFVTEGLQYFHLVSRLGLQHNTFARVVIGTSFSIEDLLCYTIGIVIVLFTEKVFHQKYS